MSDTVRLAVIGCGGRAGRLVQQIAEFDQVVELVGVLDPDQDGVRSRLPERFADAPFYGSVGELHRGARPTAVLVGTRCHLHTEYAIEAVDLDLPLFLEKPVSISMEQARRLEAAYAGRYERVVVSFPLRVSSIAELIAGRIRAGAVGTPEHIAATNYVSYGTVYWEQGYRDYTITGGLFLQKATHDFDYLAMLMGSPIVQVAAMGNYGRVFGGDKPPGLRCSECDETATCQESPENRRRNGLRTADDHLCLFSSDTRTDEGTNEGLLDRAAAVRLRRARHLHAGVLHAPRRAPARRRRLRLPGDDRVRLVHLGLPGGAPPRPLQRAGPPRRG